MGRRQLMHVVPFPVGSSVSMKTRTVPGGHSSFQIADGISWEIDGFRSRTGAAAPQAQKGYQPAEGDGMAQGWSETARERHHDDTTTFRDRRLAEGNPQPTVRKSLQEERRTPERSSILLKLVERLISEDRKGLFRVRHRKDDDRTLAFTRRRAIAALDIDASLSQQVSHFVQGSRLVFQA
jgi:hypothetical protein